MHINKTNLSKRVIQILFAAMALCNIDLRILQETSKSKYSRFYLENVKTFKLPDELKEYLLKEHGTLLRPATTTAFKMGYFIEGRGMRKFDIVDQTTLEQAYKQGVGN